MTKNPTPALPTLSAESIDRMEAAVFAEIARERHTASPKRAAHPRRRAWLTAGGVAAAFTAGVLVTPPILATVTASTSYDSASVTPASAPMGGDEGRLSGAMEDMGMAEAGAADSSFQSGDGMEGRDILASGYATVRVTEVAAAATKVQALADALGGYVESTNIGEQLYNAVDTSMPVPPGGDYGWVSIRVPADVLSKAMADLSTVGEVQQTSVSRTDVTSTAIDLRARVEATRASVERLTELMAQSGSVSELIDAEVALSDRQAQLESWEQQLKALEDQVAMSSLSVELQRTPPATTADATGFGDGLLAGWNGLIVSLNALVIAAGFILPWLGVAAVIVLIIWLIVRARRRRTGTQAPITTAD